MAFEKQRCGPDDDEAGRPVLDQGLRQLHTGSVHALRRYVLLESLFL